MKRKLLLVLALLSFASAQFTDAAEKPAATDDSSPAKADLNKIIEQVRAKLTANKRTEADLKDELKSFDDAIAKYKGEKTDDVAQILQMKGMLYLQVLENDAKAIEAFEQLKKDYPDTKPGKAATQTIEMVKKQQEAKKLRSTLVVGTKFPDFDVKDLSGNPLSIGKYKGKVVLLDFWATWCGPCVNELPNVLKAYEDYHSKGFEIIGISLDRDQKKLEDFLKDKKMAWAQYYDGLFWQNKLAVKYGVNSIPATYLLDGQGVIIGKDLRGDDLSTAVAKALEKK